MLWQPDNHTKRECRAGNPVANYPLPASWSFVPAYTTATNPGPELSWFPSGTSGRAAYERQR